MRFEVPQFIDVQDKIIAGMTLQQFLFVGGGIGIGIVAYRTLPPIINIAVAAVAAGSGAGLAFLKYNGRPLLSTIEAAFFYKVVHTTRLYVWQQRTQKKGVAVTDILSETNKILTNSKKSQNKEPAKETKSDSIINGDGVFSDLELKDLAWSLDILDKQNQSSGGVIHD